MDQFKSEQNSLGTRREYMRKVLTGHFAEVLKDKLTLLPMHVSDEKNLQGTKFVNNSDNNNKNHSNESKDNSVWNAYAHPIRRFRRTYEFTKPDSEYFGNSQWRRI